MLPLCWHSYGHYSLQCDALAILVVWPLGATVLILDVVHFVDGHTTQYSVVIMLVITGIFSPLQLVVGYLPVPRMVLFNPWMSHKEHSRVLRYSSLVTHLMSQQET